MAVALGRASQLLPSVKCSSCNAPVPLNELGDHVCATPPPLPVTSPSSRSTSLDLPRPAHSQVSASNLLPPRLQGRVGSPAPSTRSARSDHSGSISSLSSIQTARARDPYAPTTGSPLAGARDRKGSNVSSQSVPYPSRSPLAPRPSAEMSLPASPPKSSFSPSSSMPRHEEPATHTGGDAGMAGVGRRGFAAAARVAMFALSSPHREEQPSPAFLDIDNARSGSTPPLSPGSGYSSSHSAGPPSPTSQFPESHIPHISRSPSPLPSMPSEEERSPTQDPLPPSLSRVPLFEKYKDKLPTALVNTGGYRGTSDDGDNTARLNPSSPSSPGSDYGNAQSAVARSTRPMPNRQDSLDTPSSASSAIGLAYADSTEDDDEVDYRKEEDVIRGAKELRNNAAPAGRSILRSPTNASNATSRIRFPSQSSASAPRKRFDDDSDSAYSEEDEAGHGKSTPTPRKIQQRRRSSRSDYSREDTASVQPKLKFPASPARRSNTLQSPTTSSFALPTRSKTADSRTTENARRERERANSTAKKIRVCARCETKIVDGRWVAVDGGRSMCEKCWKNMYLPKCRRCSLPIEKQAVSSSDGQLKGKYHRECFTCFTCNKPFPDKTFYVFDGKPLCAYHYHESNNSLCRSSKCGEPIEGPCAVSHAGHRYHPEHLTCEFPGYPRCDEQLKEYYEMDGRMLCERHANLTTRANEDEEADDFDASGAPLHRTNTRAKKRITQFIDLNSGLR